MALTLPRHLAAHRDVGTGFSPRLVTRHSLKAAPTGRRSDQKKNQGTPSPSLASAICRTSMQICLHPRRRKPHQVGYAVRTFKCVQWYAQRTLPWIAYFHGNPAQVFGWMPVNVRVMICASTSQTTASDAVYH